MARVQQPIIPVIGDWIRANPDTISLGQGIVHYSPPPSISGTIARFWDDPSAHQYGPVEGLDPLRDAIAEKLEAENRMSLGHRAIAVTAGSNMGFLNMLLAITDPGDEIILPKPFYFNQEMAIRIADCVPVTVPTDVNGALDVEAPQPFDFHEDTSDRDRVSQQSDRRCLFGAITTSGKCLVQG